MNREGPGKIGYLDFVWNPIVGCTNGCSYCWARRQAKRQKHNCLRCYNFEPHLHPERLDEPLRRREPSVIGVAFMGDLFDPALQERERDRVFGVMALAYQHTFCVLTKRPDRVRLWHEHMQQSRRGFWHEEIGYLVQRLAGGDAPGWADVVPTALQQKAWESMRHHYYPAADPEILGDTSLAAPWPLPNVVLGVSVEDQASADRLIPELLACPASTRIVSIEPMRGAVYLSRFLCDHASCEDWGLCRGRERDLCSGGGRGLDGVILGGQTGSGAVPMHPDWVRQVRDQCAEAGVPFFFKQWGEWHPVSEYNFSTEMWRHGMIRVGRKRAGRTLDGRTHDEVPWKAGLRPEA